MEEPVQICMDAASCHLYRRADRRTDSQNHTMIIRLTHMRDVTRRDEFVPTRQHSVRDATHVYNI